MRHTLIVATIVSLLSFPAPSLAQTSVGEIFGRVTDDSGAVLPGVFVTLESPALIQPITTLTSARGTYQAPGLAIGSYTVRLASRVSPGSFARAFEWRRALARK